MAAHPRRLRGEALWVVLGQIGVLTGTLALVRVQTGLLSPIGYGQLALAMTAFGFGQTVVFGGLNMAITRLYAPAHAGGGLTNYLHTGKRALLWLSGFWCMALLLLALTLFASAHSEWAAIALMVLPYSLLNGCVSVLVAFHSARRARRVVALHQLVDVWLRVGGVCLAGQVFGPSLFILFAVYALSSLIILVSLATVSRLTDSPDSSRKADATRHDFLAYAWPIYVWSPFVWAQLSIDRWALDAFATGTAVGLYAAAAQLTFGPARIALTAFLRFFTSVLFDGISDGKENMPVLRRIGLFALTATLAGFALTSVWHAKIFAFAAGTEFQSASIYLPWLLLAAGLIATGEVLTLTILGRQDTKALIAPKVASALTGIFLSLLGAAWIGIWGVVAAQVAHAALYLIWIITRLAPSHMRGHDRPS
ncbi:lipopolysaccharide biosynthesis protein [Ruegeria sp. HKCCD8929]|uniref:lipopolysaccharide biosynthesis protein n=1 Tax=Ruegeria sp. HKCCD8929 TaxID=2683006 RepID=UPI0014877685|nr:lipopolysaccharide biosynthesis protein [Ruegeria sp. HKCCD8929]